MAAVISRDAGIPGMDEDEELLSLLCSRGKGQAHKEQACKAIIYDDCNKIIDCGNQRAGGNGRVYMHFVKKQGDYRSHKTGNYHGEE